MLIGPATDFEKENVSVDRETCIKTFRENIRNSGIRDYNVLFSLQKQDYSLIKNGKILDKIIDVLENSGEFSLVWELLNSILDNFRKWYNLCPLDSS